MSRVLRAFARDTREHVAGMDLCAVLDRENGVDRQEVAGLQAVGQLDRSCRFVVVQRDARLQIAAARLLLPVGDDSVGDAGGFVHHFAHRHAFDQVEVMRDARASR